MSPVTLTLTLLGVPSVATPDGPVALSRGTTTLCAYLALAPGGRARDAAAAHLFGDCPERDARRRLSTALWRLRTELRELTGVDALADEGPRTMRLSSAVELTVDAAIFERLAAPALTRPAAELTPAEIAQLEQAVALHRGQLLEQCADEWVMAERARIENLYLTALDALVQHYGIRGELGAVGKYGELALSLEPLREDIHRHLMDAYARGGRDDLVERQFERCRAALLEELGVDPMPETVALYSRLRRGADASASPSVAALVAELERARREIDRLGGIVDRALEHLHRMR